MGPEWLGMKGLSEFKSRCLFWCWCNVSCLMMMARYSVGAVYWHRASFCNVHMCLLVRNISWSVEEWGWMISSNETSGDKIQISVLMPIWSPILVLICLWVGHMTVCKVNEVGNLGGEGGVICINLGFAIGMLPTPFKCGRLPFLAIWKKFGTVYKVNVCNSDNSLNSEFSAQLRWS